jgi:hypothetical protein
VRSWVKNLKKYIKDKCAELNIEIPTDIDNLNIDIDRIYRTGLTIDDEHGYFSTRCKHTLEEMQKIAERKGGKCLSSGYNPYIMKWQCSNGHIWECASDVIIKGVWCQLCHHFIRGQKYTFLDMHKLAEKYNGKCLSIEFVSAGKKMLWECENGHQFETCPSYIIFSKRWCRQCRIDNKSKNIIK